MQLASIKSELAVIITKMGSHECRIVELEQAMANNAEVAALDHCETQPALPLDEDALDPLE